MSIFEVITALEFQWPWLILLAPLPWLFKFGKKAEQPEDIAPLMPLFQTVKSLGVGSLPSEAKTSRLNQIGLALAWLCLVVAICRPTYIGEQIDVPLSGRDLMLGIDISPSMKENDMKINGVAQTRLEIVKRVVTDFVEAREGDRIGLILFGSEPYIQAPLTFDTQTVNTLLQEAYLGMAGQATAIGDAIALGVKRLRQRPEQSRVLILLTDGANTAGEIPPEKAAQLAAQEKIRIYTVGIGAEEMIKRSFFGSKKVNPSADLDEEMLQQIAGLTDGEYFRARNTDELTGIYDLINKLEPVEQETKSYRPSKALFYWFLGLALGIYALLVSIKMLKRLFQHRKLASFEEVK